VPARVTAAETDHRCHDEMACLTARLLRASATAATTHMHLLLGLLRLRRMLLPKLGLSLLLLLLTVIDVRLSLNVAKEPKLSPT